MKINSELERILLAQQQVQTPKAKGADSSTVFDDVLQQAIQQSDANINGLEGNASLSAYGTAAVQNTSAAETGSIAPALDTETDGNSEARYSAQKIVSGIEHSLSGLDAYTSSLKNLDSGASLKQAWQNLSAFTQSVENLRQNYADLSQQDSSLNAMINNLEIMAVTETYKFNRGDYSL